VGGRPLRPWRCWRCCETGDCLALAPVAAALFIGLAPARITERMYSMFDLNDPTNRDRVAMMRAGVRMIGDHRSRASTGAVGSVYEQYRDPSAVEPVKVHLHTCRLQITASGARRRWSCGCGSSDHRD